MSATANANSSRAAEAKTMSEAPTSRSVALRPSLAICPNMDFRSITREEHEDARQVARDIATTRQYEVSMKLRKKVEMRFAHLKRILGLGRLRLRGPCGANDEFLLAATAQNLRKLAKILPAPQKPRKA